MAREIRCPGVFVLVLTALLTAPAGCGISSPVVRTEDRFLQKTRDTYRAVKRYKVACLPILMPDPGGMKEGAWVLEHVSSRFREELIGCLKVAGVFTEVHPVGGSTAEDFDLELEIRLTEADLRYAGKNVNFLLSLPVMALFSPIASSFIAADDFLGTLKFELVVRETVEGKVLCRRTFHVRERIPLDAFQCGFGIGELLFTIPSLAGFRGEEVEARVAPHLFRSASIRICETLAREIPVPEMDVILAVGVDRVDYKTLNCAEKDAERFNGLLENRPGRKHPRLLFLGKEATVDSVLAALDSLRKGGDFDIRDLIVYYAGCGTNVRKTRKGKSFYVPCIYLFGKSGKESHPVPVPLGVIAKKMRAVRRCANRVLIVDAGFTEEEGRARHGAWLGDPRTFRQPFSGEKGLAVLLASSPGYTAYEDSATREGVFTRFLMEFRDKTVDRNRDGVISVREIATYVPWKVNRWAQGNRNGKMSNPLFLGSGTLFRLTAEKRTESGAGKEGKLRTPGKSR